MLGAFLFAWQPAVKAQDVAAGEAVARQQCSECHYVGKSATPPFGFAPAFSKIARSEGVTQTSIQVFLMTHHEVMPNYALSRKDVIDVAAYIVTLR